MIQTAKEELLTNNCIALGNVCFARTIINKVFNGLVYFYKCGVMNVKCHEFIVEPQCSGAVTQFLGVCNCNSKGQEKEFRLQWLVMSSRELPLNREIT